MRHLPESVIIETTEYKILQSQFSVLYNESMQVNTSLDEARAQLAKSRAEYSRYIEVLESNELEEQKKLRNELLQKQYILDQTRKEFENLRNKYEQNLAANEQTAPINREMRQLISSLQTRNGQFNKQIQRYKRKYQSIVAENTKLRKDLEEMTEKLNAAGIKQEKDIKNESTASATEDEPLDVKNMVKDESAEKIKAEPDENDSDNDDKSSLTPTDKTSGDAVKKEDAPAGTNNVAKLDRENRDLKAQLKKALNDLKDTKVVMDTYKGVSKEQRDKVQLMAAEKKVRAELEELKAQMKKMQENKREDRKKLADEDALKRMKQLEEKNCELQKQVSAQQKVADGQWVSGYRPFVGSNVS
jgi:E3 ubiquitin-protein ligase BRE1